MQPPRLLEESIDQAPEAIEREKSRGIQRFGKAFEEGDHIAIIALQQITIQIQSSLLEQLREAAYDDDVTDFRALADAADMGRDRTVSTLLDLRQRLLQASTINEISHMSIGSRTSTGSATISSQMSAPTSQPRDMGPDEAPSHRQFLKHRRTLTPETATSGYISNADDAASGAEDSQRKLASKNRNKSLFGFLAHHRTHSSEQVPKSVEDAAQQATKVPGANTPFHPPQHCDVRDEATSINSGSTVKATASQGDATSVRSGSTSEPKFTYEEGEDNPFEIWGAKKPAAPERRDTQIAPDSMASMSRQSTYNSIVPGTPFMTRTFSNTGSINPPGGVGHGHQASIAIGHPSADNNFLGFCKGAVKLQNGDRKGLTKCKDYMYSAQSNVYYLACSASKCAFAGHYNPNIIWDKVWVDKPKGIKFRWPFLAKSHVQQKTVKQDQYAYQCLFCVYLGNTTPVMHGMDLYLEHISHEHRGHAISDVVLYKCGAANDRELEDTEEFDINLLPLSVEEFDKRRKNSNVLSDDLMAPDLKRSDTIAKDSMFSNEPWNEGLSEFHYGGNNEFDYTAMYERDFCAAELEG